MIDVLCVDRQLIELDISQPSMSHTRRSRKALTELPSNQNPQADAKSGVKAKSKPTAASRSATTEKAATKKAAAEKAAAEKAAANEKAAAVEKAAAEKVAAEKAAADEAAAAERAAEQAQEQKNKQLQSDIAAALSLLELAISSHPPLHQLNVSPLHCSYVSPLRCSYPLTMYVHCTVPM